MIYSSSKFEYLVGPFEGFFLLFNSSRPIRSGQRLSTLHVTCSALVMNIKRGMGVVSTETLESAEKSLLPLPPKRVTLRIEEADGSLITKYLPLIQKSSRRTILYIGSDVLFLTVRRKRTEWGAMGRKNKPIIRETVVLVLAKYGVYRLEVPDTRHQGYLGRILSKIQYGSIDSVLTLVEALGVQTPYGQPYVRMNQTKLEYYL